MEIKGVPVGLVRIKNVSLGTAIRKVMGGDTPPKSCITEKKMRADGKVRNKFM